MPERAVIGKLDHYLIQSLGPLLRGRSNFEKGLREGFLSESGTASKEVPPASGGVSIFAVARIENENSET